MLGAVDAVADRMGPVCRRSTPAALSERGYSRPAQAESRVAVRGGGKGRETLADGSVVTI